MPRAELSISLPTDVWLRDVSTAHPATEFEVVTALAGERAGIALLSVASDYLVSILTDVEGRRDVTGVELIWKRDSTGLLQVETESAPLLLPLWRAGIPIEMPFSVRDGTATWELTTSSDRLSELGSLLEETDIGYDLEYVAEIGASEVDRLLTDRQREVLLAAFEAGYYAVPRESTLTEVAEELDVSKATASDVVHRAESALVSWFLREHASRPGGSPVR